MEPADIDWKNIESRFVRDETYEHINAPMWLDLSAPDSPSAAAANDAWFCRPECRHPKTADDFLKLSPSPKSVKPIRMPLGERKSGGLRDGNSNANANAINNSLKRRGAVASLLLSSSSPVRDPTKKNSKGNVKKLREDAENQDPNLLVGNGTSNGTSTTSKRPVKTLREAIKSSAEKKGVVVNQEEGEKMRSKKPVPRLRSTLSARNLFSGRDILGQISEFCHEIKKLAVGKEKSSAAAREEEAEEERKALVDANSKGDDGDGSVNVEIEEKNCKKNGDEKLSVLKEVRACPPTPQRFPPPSSHRLQSTKPAASASSPLKKPLEPVAAPERGILQELDQGREEKRAAAAAKDEEGKRVSAAAAAAAAAAESSEGSSMDMFWFLKPCTYLAK